MTASTAAALAQAVWSSDAAWWKLSMLARGVIWQDAPNDENLLSMTLPAGTSGIPQRVSVMTGRHPDKQELQLVRVGDERARLQMDEHQLDIQISNESEVLANVLSTGVPLGAAVFPSGDWLATGFRAEGKVRTPLMSIDEVIESIRLWRRDRPLRGILLAPPMTDRRTGGIAFLESYIRAIKDNFSIQVILEIEPPTDLMWVERAYAWGADGIFMPLRGDAGYDKRFLNRAKQVMGESVEIFPSGAVATSINPFVDTERSFEIVLDIVELGAVPYCYVQGEFGDTMIEDITALSTQLSAVELAPDYWLSGIGHLVSPNDLVALTQQVKRGQLDRFFASPVGRSLLNKGGSMRRSLRVIDSFPTASH